MNPLLTLLLSFALSQIKPEMIASLLAELVEFLDPLMAKRGFVLRQVWSMILRPQLASPAVVKEAAELLTDISDAAARRQAS